MSQRKRLLGPMLVTLLMVLVVLQVAIPGMVQARTTRTLSDGSKEVDLEFPDGDEEHVVDISIPKVARLESARVGISGRPLGSIMQYAMDPALDIGNDGDVEWRYRGMGYGSLGRQSMFSDNSTSAEVFFSGPDVNRSLAIRLPVGASITEATMKVTGEPFAENWWNDEWLQRVPVTVHEPNGVSMGNVTVDVYLDLSNFSVSSQKEFRVIRQQGQTHREVPSQIVDPEIVSGRILGTRIAFVTEALASGETQEYYIYFSNQDPPDPPMRTQLRANDILNRLEDPLDIPGPVSKPDHLRAPHDVDTDGDRIYVADTENHVVRIFDLMGQTVGHLGMIGMAGSDTSHLDSPHGVAVGPDGRIFVSDTNNNRIMVFNPNLTFNMSITEGVYIFPTGTNLSSPHGLFVKDNGELALADTGNHIVQVFHPNGTYKEHIGHEGLNGSDDTHLDFPYDVIVRADGGYMVADYNNHRVQVFDSDLTYSDTIGGTMGSAQGQLRNPSSVDYHGDNAYVVDSFNQRVQVFSGSSFVKQYGKTGYHGMERDSFDFPLSVVVDDRGVILVADTDNNRVVRITDLSVDMGSEEGIYPSELAIDFGDDGHPEWEHPGALKTSATSSDMKVRMNVAIDSVAPVTDGWGNQYAHIPINVSSGSRGKLLIEDLDIMYDHVAKIDFTDSFEEILTASSPDDDGDIQVPLAVTADSGTVRISNISVVYDMPPTLIGDIPSTYSVEEDTHDPHVIDLHDFFKDDVDGPENLTFKTLDITNASIVHVSILDNRYISVDAYNGSHNDNWHGSVEMRVSCTNGRDLRTVSNLFSIDIEPVNDPPYFTSTPKTKATEEEAYQYIPTAEDPDGDPLTYNLAFGPTGMFMDHGTGEVTWSPTNDQVGVQEVTLEVSDGDPLSGTGKQTFNITVRNVNDPPTIESDPVLEAFSGQQYKYTVLTSDQDGDDLTFSLERAPEGMTIGASSGEIVWTPKEDQVGTHKVKIVISDGNTTVEQEFEITVEGEGGAGGLPIPMEYLILGLLLILVIIIISVAAVISRKRRRKKAKEERIRKERMARERRRREAMEEDEVDEGPEECPKCGDILEPGLGFCPSCGLVLESEEEVAPEAKGPVEEGTTAEVEIGGEEPEAGVEKETEPEEVVEEEGPEPGPPAPGPPTETVEEREPEEASVDGPEEASVEEPEEASVDGPEEASVEEEPPEEEEKDKGGKEEGDRSLDDILSALKD